MEKGRIGLRYEEIKRMLNLPEFKGVMAAELKNLNSFALTLPPLECNLDSWEQSPEYGCDKKNTGGHEGDFSAASGDHSIFSEKLTGGEERVGKWSQADEGSSLNEHAAPHSEPIATVPDLLSGYNDYLREFLYGSSNTSGVLRTTGQGTVSLNFGMMQVDVTINGAIRIVNPKTHIAMAVNDDCTATAVMHPMGRLHHDAQTVLLLAWDSKNHQHKHAKFLPKKSAFKSNDMSFSYVMDSAGARTSMSKLPTISMNDISLPVFYNNSPHGTKFKAAAEAMANSAIQYTDGTGCSVWKMGSVIIKHRNGELKVSRPPSVYMRTSALTGCLGISTDEVHCTATQGEQCHMFARYGVNKMHTDGLKFKIKTEGQTAGFDDENRITLF
ncbi:Hypothetical predicted protein [Cloeon dipterum]|uniref:Uncharacterized protein n=1 Tax=Cloeon dipterum TaxID=197152 RepID=A0A8S1D2P4_9INSE|nr:Hypothetical predicted protein [Cloeon dipterum]